MPNAPEGTVAGKIVENTVVAGGVDALRKLLEVLKQEGGEYISNTLFVEYDRGQEDLGVVVSIEFLLYDPSAFYSSLVGEIENRLSSK